MRTARTSPASRRPAIRTRASPPARIEFGYTLLPDPCPSPELAAKDAKNYQAYVDFMKQEGVRVANMSWGGNVKGVRALARAVRHRLSRSTSGGRSRASTTTSRRVALTNALASAPDILFVASAGNSNSDATFDESYPAVDRPAQPHHRRRRGQGGRRGALHQLRPDGGRACERFPGRQLHSRRRARRAVRYIDARPPQVTNLAAKILAINPDLKPQEVIAVIRDKADRTPDGRRILLNPKKAIAAVEEKSSA